jgi:hypothetical protein
MQDDAVWGLNAGSEIFEFNFSTGKLVQVQGELTQITVGDWLHGQLPSLGSLGNQRRSADLQIQLLQHLVWDNTPGFLTRISTGGGDVWGVNAAGQVFQYNFLLADIGCKLGALCNRSRWESNAVWGLDKVRQRLPVRRLRRFCPDCPGPKRTVKSWLGKMGSGESLPRRTSIHGLILRLDP